MNFSNRAQTNIQLWLKVKNFVSFYFTKMLFNSGSYMSHDFVMIHVIYS